MKQRLLLLLFALNLSLIGHSTVVTHTFSATSGTIDANVSFACQQNSSATAPAFNTNLRLYYAANGDGCSITLTPSNGVTITQVKINAVSSYAPTVKYNVDGGADATASLASLVYTISGVTSISSLKIRNANTTNTQLRITSIEITYDIPATNDLTSKVEAPTTQTAAADIASTATSNGSAIEVFKFKISDLGTADGLATKVTQIRIKKSSGTADWTDHIAGAELWDGVSQITTGTVAITDTDITFPISSGNMDVTDGGNKELTLKIWLKTTNIVDNSTMVFTVSQTSHGFTADADGSGFSSDFGAAVTSNTMTVTVVATKLTFIQQPTNVATNTNISPAVTLSANDANNNRDLDYTLTVSISATGLTGSPVSVSPVSGLATFSTLAFSGVASGVTLNASSGSLTGVISNSFNVNMIPKVFISEYLEGTSNNKVIEIYNGENNAIDLSKLTLKMYANGASSANYTIDNLVGTLESGSVYIIANSNSNLTILALANSTNSSVNTFNGDDAIEVLYDGTTTDIFGIIGTDPGTSWTIAGNNSATLDKSAIRKLSIIQGNQNWTLSAGTNTTDSEWVIISTTDYTSNLGVFGTVWKGTANTDWTSSLNWDVSVPSSGNNVVIPDVTNDPVISSQQTANNLIIKSGGVLNVETSGQLTISGTLNNSAGASGLVIESDATGTGSVIHSTAGVAATVERYIPGVSNAWHLLGSPVEAQGISGDWIAGNYDFYAYDEATATWLNQKVGANNITSFTPGKGYLVAYETAAQTKSFSGNLNNGNVVIAVTKGGTGDHAGANLLANPYASGIDWNTATRTLFADNFAYVYDQTANTGAGAFTTIDGGAGNAWIAPHQGFFVLAETAGDFTFTNAMREHGGTYTKNGAADEHMLAIRLSGETHYDVTRIRIKEDASTLRDRSDAIKFYSYTPNVPQIYSQSEDGKNLTLNSIPQISDESSIQLGMLIAETGTYTLNIESALGQFGAEKIYVEDTQLGMSHNLSENGAYSFVATPGDNPNRFLLHFGAVGVAEQPESAALKAYVVGAQLYFPLQGEATLEIVDLQGRLLQQSKVSGQGLASQPLQLTAGAYVVRLTSGQNAQTAKVIVK